MIIIELKHDATKFNFVVEVVKNHWKLTDEEAVAEVRRWLFSDVNTRTCFIGIYGGLPVATCVLDDWSDVDESLSPWGTLLWVKPEHRNKGFGKELIDFVGKYAKNYCRLEKIYCDVSDAKDYHLRFYPGWKEIKQLQYEGKNITIMERTL